LQIDGSRETSAYLHGLLGQEIELVGSENVVLWGLSMECVAALVAGLTWEREPFGAVVGMCGWLPFRKGIDVVVRGNEGEDGIGGEEEDIFESNPEVDGEGDPAVKAIAWLGEELDMPKGQNTVELEHVPVFLCYGVEDDKVPINLGREAADCLKALGIHVRRKEYDGLGHWYSEDMLKDIKQSLQERDKIQVDHLPQG
jgi:pimeloyl-ACP methyl ester carboxylesterase